MSELTKAKNKQEKIDRIGGVIALLIIAISAIIGFQKKIESRENIIAESIPGIEIISRVSPNLLSITFPNEVDTSFLALGRSQGYGGNLTMAVIIDVENKIEEAICIENVETPSFMARIDRRNYSREFKEIDTETEHSDQSWPDVITGATYTTEAMSLAVQSATGTYREEKLGLGNWMPEKEPFHWKWHYSLLISIFILSWLINMKWFPLKKASRWIIMLFNIGFLGFWLGNQLSISQISRLLMGDFPSINTHFFFYLLLAGTVLIILLINKNLYYDRICPFGAAQQCVNVISGTKRHIRSRYITWFQRILVLVIISISLIFQNPTRFNYEVFSAFFKIIGTVFQFSLLIIVLLSSLFFVRPWCNVLCPIKPVMDFIRMIRRWVVG